MHRQDHFIDLMLSDANLLGSIYGKMDDIYVDDNNDESQVFQRVTIALQ
jgi:hypothetical protein